MPDKNSRSDKSLFNNIKKTLKRILKRIVNLILLLLFLAFVVLVLTVVFSALLCLIKTSGDSSRTFIQSFIYNYPGTFKLMIKINSIIAFILFSILPMNEVLSELENNDEDK